MKIFNNLYIPKKYKRSSLAIGNFDGVHKGHQRVFKYAKTFARKNRSKFGVLTFSPLPVMFFNKGIKNYRLTSEDEKVLVIGDNIRTDIKGANNMKLDSLFITNGVHRDEFMNLELKNYDKILEKYKTKTNYYLEKLTW